MVRTNNIFSQVFLLFMIGCLLLFRHRGSAVPSTQYDQLVGGVMIVYSIVRFLELLGSNLGNKTCARGIAWVMWFIPLVISTWLFSKFKWRIDTAIPFFFSLAGVIGSGIYLMTNNSGNGTDVYDLVLPHGDPSTSGIFGWVHRDNLSSTSTSLPFLPLAYYIILLGILFYLIVLSYSDMIFWLLVILAAALFAVVCIANPLNVTTVGSASGLIVLALGMMMIFITPG